MIFKIICDNNNVTKRRDRLLGDVGVYEITTATSPSNANVCLVTLSFIPSHELINFIMRLYGNELGLFALRSRSTDVANYSTLFSKHGLY